VLSDIILPPILLQCHDQQTNKQNQSYYPSDKNKNLRTNQQTNKQTKPTNKQIYIQTQQIQQGQKQKQPSG
jgi:hypothetical protein